MTEPVAPSSARPAQAPIVVGHESEEAPTPDQAGSVSTAGADAPSVVAVVVARDPGEHFEECLQSLGDQDYGNLSVLVVDAGSAAPVAERVAEVLPDAFLHRMTGNATFTMAANQALTLVDGASFLLFCHDDVALDDHCVSVMIEELYRSNAGIVTPKVVRWDDPRRLLQLGMGSDRFGVQVDLLDPNEFDQEQYDSVRDVFVAPGGVQLVRADLFDALGGFDTAMASVSADLDLCWRAHAAGARVIAVPSARVRHAEVDDDGTAELIRRDRGRNRLRTVLVTASRFSLFRVLPLAIVLLLVEALYSLLAGRRRQAASAVGALTWNAGRVSEIRARRRSLEAIRTVPDSEIHALQFGGSARISGFFRGQFGSSQDRFVDMFGSMRSSLAGDNASSVRVGALAGSLLGVIMVFGSRHLITRGVVPVGQIPVLPGGWELLGEWFGGWRSAGLGSPGNPSSVFALFGLLRLVFFWADGIPELLLVVGPLIMGAVGAWRLARPLASPQASSAAAIAYSLNPLPVSAIAAGRWDALVVWGFAPLLLGSILRVQGITPFGGTGGPAGPGVVERALPIRLLRFGMAVALVATFVPVAPLVALVMVVLVALASVVVARTAGVVRLLLAIPVAIATPVALHLPWAYDVLRHGSWNWFVGPRSPEARFDSMADLMRFAPGSVAPSMLTVGLLVAAGFGLVVARGRRFDAVVAGWVLALGSFFAGWAVRRDWFGFELPTAEMLLVPGAVGLSLAVAAGIRSIEVDVPPGRSWRRLVVAGGVAGLSVLGVAGLRSALNGQWELPTQDYGVFAEGFSRDDGVTQRVLWLAAPEVARFDTMASPEGLHYAVTSGGRPDAFDRWAPAQSAANARIGTELDLVVEGETVQLGRLLAIHGIDFVVVVPQFSPYIGPEFSAGDGVDLVAVLQAQLDLQRVTGAPGLAVFSNRSSVGTAMIAPGLSEVSVDPADRLGFDLGSASRSSFTADGAGAWSSQSPPPGETIIAVPGDGWQVTAGNATARTSASGLLVVDVDEANEGEVRVAHHTPALRRLALALQAVLTVAAFLLAQTRREGSLA